MTLENEMLTALFNEFKARLRITWEDEAESALLKNYILSGHSFLCGHAMGAELDYSKDLHAKELLYNYVLYCRSDALSQFRAAYTPDLLNLRMRYEVREEAEQLGNTEQT